MPSDWPINRFSRRPKRSKEPLPPKSDPEAIPAVRNIGLRIAGDDVNTASGGTEWPLTEVSRTTQIVRIYDPHDATRYVDVEQATSVTFRDVAGDTRVLNLTP